MIERFQQFSTLSKWKRLFTLWLAGALSTLALAPFFATPILLLTIPTLLLTVRFALSTKQAAFHGWAFGLGYFSAGLYWFAHALLIDAAKFGWLIPLALLGIGGGLALYIALVGWFSYRVRTLPYTSYCISFALLWTIAEIARSTLFSGFPWNLIGYSWGAYETTLQSASLGGIWLLSLLTMLLASMPLWLCKPTPSYKTCIVTLIGFLGLLYYGNSRLANNPTLYEDSVGLRLVQASIKQELKWDAERRAEAIKQHLDLSAFRLGDDITHIIWPESAMTYRFEEGDFWTQELAKFAPENGALMTGVVRVDRINPERTAIYNSIKTITADEQIDAVYDKRKLVPFGEYVPFRNILPIDKITHGALDFDAGNNAEPLTTRGAPPFQPLICYEAIFPWLSQNTHPAWLLNVTNDGWFGTSTGPYQHFHMTRMRAVEQGVPLVRAANNGISAVIDPYGRIVAKLGLNEVGIVDSKLPEPADTHTVYAQYGLLPLYGISALLMLYILASLRRQRALIRFEATSLLHHP